MMSTGAVAPSSASAPTTTGIDGTTATAVTAPATTRPPTTTARNAPVATSFGAMSEPSNAPAATTADIAPITAAGVLRLTSIGTMPKNAAAVAKFSTADQSVKVRRNGCVNT